MKKLEEMTLQEKIGQLIIVGFYSTYYDQHICELVEKYRAGNIILFTRNFTDASQLKTLTTSLYNHIVKENDIIPFIAIDQEGGMVTRLVKDVTFAPSQMTCGASNFSSSAYTSGKIIARDMIKLGLNLDFAPCLEVNNELKNYTVNVRSYGASPKLVATLAHQFIKGLAEYGVLACTKHFPGEGKCLIDTHLELPILDVSKEEMHKTGLVPFKENIDVPCIMTTHTLFKAYDEYPATLSPKVIKGLLREELGYKGMIVSDCLEMKAIQDHYTTPGGAVLALKAGCDMVLVCHTKELQESAFEKVYEAVQNGIITEAEIDEKIKRILAFKRQILPYLEKYFLNNQLYELDENSSRLAQKIVDESLTKVLGDVPTIDGNTVVFAPTPRVSSIVEDEFEKRDLATTLKTTFENLKVINLEDDMELPNLNNYQKIIVFSYDACKNLKQQNIINQILDNYPNVYVISLKGPMDKEVLHNLKNYMCLYEYTPNSIRTIIKFFKKELSPLGHLPLGYN